MNNHGGFTDEILAGQVLYSIDSIIVLIVAVLLHETTTKMNYSSKFPCRFQLISPGELDPDHAPILYDHHVALPHLTRFYTYLGKKKKHEILQDYDTLPLQYNANRKRLSAAPPAK